MPEFTATSTYHCNELSKVEVYLKSCFPRSMTVLFVRTASLIEFRKIPVAASFLSSTEAAGRQLAGVLNFKIIFV